VTAIFTAVWGFLPFPFFHPRCSVSDRDTMEAILDFSKPVDVPTLDAVCAVFNDPSNPQASFFFLYGVSIILERLQHEGDKS
jgi:hypothetical protein